MIPCLALALALALVWQVVGCSDMSQYGQSGFVARLVEGQAGAETPKTFIEFGCADGRKNSNTWMFECLGWRGFCVEPVDVIHGRKHGHRGVVCRPEEEGTLKAVTVASLSGLHGVRPNLWPFGARAQGVEQSRCVNLHTLRREHGIGEVGYMTVDTEGNEAELLRAYRPERWARFVQVECNERAACETIREVMTANFTLVRVWDFRNGRGGRDMLWRRR